MAVQLSTPLPAAEVGPCRHCDQPLQLRPSHPAPFDPDSYESWWSVLAGGTSNCPGPTAVGYDCPACWGCGATAPDVACQACDGKGRRADHAPLVSAVAA